MSHTIEVRQYTAADRTVWERFLQQCNNATMFHRQAFLDYHAPGKFQFHHLMFYRAGKLIAVMPGGFPGSSSSVLVTGWRQLWGLCCT